MDSWRKTSVKKDTPLSIEIDQALILDPEVLINDRKPNNLDMLIDTHETNVMESLIDNYKAQETKHLVPEISHIKHHRTSLKGDRISHMFKYQYKKPVLNKEPDDPVHTILSDEENSCVENETNEINVESLFNNKISDLKNTFQSLKPEQSKDVNPLIGDLKKPKFIPSSNGPSPWKNFLGYS